ncbi:Polynucleotide 5'-hydroxyl-kinase grc3 [Coemansia biformis]|uniref:Polynucleotide 5'-hydroxyl-kinase GRC3 n=1 Tax=Coemansia biformis TaxID=1286918 RepID=A0A9W7YJ66_9FUNG|nr:Polynucleotide 5'-hydroxyl-kinase grc3 [Coemansia biformis]
MQSADAKGLPAATTWSPASAAQVVLVGAEVGADGTRTLSAIDTGVSVDGRYGVVFGIHEGERIAFQGIVDVCVLEGAVSAYEHTMLPSGRWARMYSPSAYPLITLRAVRDGQPRRIQKEGESDSDIAQMRSLWSERAMAGVAEQRPTVVVALRSANCGLDNIGRAAAPFRNLFTLRPLVERKGSGLPKQYRKRQLALARIESANKAIRLGGARQEQRTNQVDGMVEESEISTASDGESGDADANSGECDGDDDDDIGAVVAYAQHEHTLAHHIGLCGFDPVARLTPDLQLLQTPPDWAEVLDQASSAALQLDSNFEPISPVYVVAGGQGLGKSTFARLLINRLVGRFGRVFYLETDLGQPELAPPGVLSLTMLTDPLLGPPFTHAGQIEPYHAVYMGVTTPKNDPDRYVHAIQRLVAAYRDHTDSVQLAHESAETRDNGHGASAGGLDKQVVPLVVNTQGWLKGLGLDLHYSLCEEVRPTNYIQVYDPAASTPTAQGQDEFDAQSWAGGNQRTPFIDFGSISECSPQLSWISAMSFERAMQTVYSRQRHPGVDAADSAEQVEQSASDSGMLVAISGDASGRKGPRITAHDTRTLTMLSLLYSSGTSIEPQEWNASLRRIADMSWSTHVPLASRCPLVVPWADLVVWLGEEDIPPSQVMRALNGSIVGVIGVAAAPSANGHVWTDPEVRGLYPDGGGIGDQAALELSGPGSRALLRTAVDDYWSAHAAQSQSNPRPPQIVYGHPSTSSTTFLAHALVRSVDMGRGQVHLLLPPLAASSMARGSRTDGPEQPMLSPLSRIVGILKGPGTGAVGIELPVWAMVDGGYTERAMGSAAARKGRRATKRQTGANGQDAGAEPANLGIQEAPYISVELDEGVGASSSRAWGGHARRTLQG